MPFSDFHGNPDVVHTMREMLAHDRFPHAVILSGPQGSGKFTLAQMIAKTMNCLERPTTDGLPDFCGRCANCVRIAEADDLESASPKPSRRARTCATPTSARRASSCRPIPT